APTREAPIVRAVCPQGTGLAPRVICLAELPAVAPQEQVSGDHAVEGEGQLLARGLLRQAVGDRIVLVLPSVPETPEHAQAVRIEGENGVAASEEEDLLGAG